MKNSVALPASITAAILVLVCCLCGGLAVGVIYFTMPRPLLDTFITPTPATVVRQESPVPTDTLVTLEDTIVPASDLRDLAGRLKGEENIPLTLNPPPAPLQVGTRQTFWAINKDNHQHFRVNATLRYVTPHSYFWIEDGVSYDETELKDLAETFENHIYPTDREFFGSEWTPGVDGDVHLYILYARGLGKNLAGLFASEDEYSPLTQPYSNAHEMFLLNADNQALNDQFTYGVLAHEFQHMIHWYRDRNETSWLNEGFSELAAFLNGYGVGGHVYFYFKKPDIQLTDWPNDPNATGPHYGASFLFLTYFLDRFGVNTTKALVGDQANGMDSIDDVLKQIGATDPLTGKPIRADDAFADWEVTSYLQDGSVADGRYTYHNYPDAPKPGATESVRICPTGPMTRDVNQYGVDYIRITCSGDYTLHFVGTTQVKVLLTDPHSGSYAFWSNKGDESDMTLTQTFDFTDKSSPLRMTYWTWYDLEKDYDYVFLETSPDGEHWQILTTPSGTAKNPSGNNYGWGYNGLSGGSKQAKWIQESVDLSQYAGEKVQLRFEYVTDPAVNGEGFLLDDVSIPAIGYSTDFEKDNAGWQAEGFVRIENVLPQTYRLELISEGATTTVTDIPLNPDITADVPLHIGSNVKDVVLVISGTTRFTRQTATYTIDIVR